MGGTAARWDPPSPLVSLDPAVRIDRNAVGVAVRHPKGSLRLTGDVFAALEPVLLDAEVSPSLAQLEEHLDRTTGDALAAATCYYALAQLQRLGLLHYSLVTAGDLLLTVVPTGTAALFEPTEVQPDVPLRLSRFALMHRNENQMVVECLDTRTRVHVARPEILALLAGFAGSVPPRDVNAPSIPLKQVCAALSFLVAAGALSAQDESPQQALWEWHDLAFHRHSRRSALPDTIGATYRFLDQQQPAPAITPARTGPRLLLNRPVANDSDPLWRLMESRRSVREYGPTPISVERLGEFLYRAARIRQVVPADRERGRPYGVTSRPYPSGGGAYELETYVTVGACSGIDPDCYHYDALAHELVSLRTPAQHVAAMLDDASAATGWEVTPQVLLTFTSRTKRLMWKYSGMAYATTLKNVGVLLQTCYLVATAMGLAPCALGAGNSDLATEALQLPELEEVAVGEFLLGSAPAGVQS